MLTFLFRRFIYLTGSQTRFPRALDATHNGRRGQIEFLVCTVSILYSYNFIVTALFLCIYNVPKCLGRISVMRQCAHYVTHMCICVYILLSPSPFSCLFHFFFPCFFFLSLSLTSSSRKINVKMYLSWSWWKHYFNIYITRYSKLSVRLAIFPPSFERSHAIVL